MSVLKVGDSFPEGVSFTYVPFTKEKADIKACGMPIKYDASKEFKNKKVVIVSVPGAFTPTCQESHLPTFLESKDKLQAKGVDAVFVIAMNDAWVMSAWGKANTSDDYFTFASDPDAAFSKSIGWEAGGRTKRYALVVDHGKVAYADIATEGIKGSDAPSVLEKL